MRLSSGHMSTDQLLVKLLTPKAREPTIGSEQSYLDYHHPTVNVEFDQSASSVKYVLGDITLAYNIEQNTRSNRTNDDIERTAASISYAIAPGLTANVTTSSTKEDVGANQDTDDVTVFALNASF